MIHRFILISYLLIALHVLSEAQGGTWVWMNGSNVPGAAGAYGTQGVASVLNSPPALYEAVQWTDKQGNFWIFGGVSSLGQLSDLWKFNPVANTWTWVKGTGAVDDGGTFGVQGVPAITNNPPARGWGVASWTDAAGDLWLYGGAGQPLAP